MSDRDKQHKYNQQSNISNSLYTRVNIGQDADKNSLDSAEPIHTGGSMNNDDERVVDNSSLTHMLLFYIIGFLMSGIIGFVFFKLFQDYFYGEGLNQAFPSLLLFAGSISIGFFISSIILKKLKL
ncbi:hypothetical protein [Carnobacterium pleistocenium]|uniref:hypothetical protein n=1 Tax=Carnobacterium pleistocenium TaxID=181073 RepID=UPI0005598048|nr:hypothetical protein [Carnobacterium pleistocenium]